MRARNRLRATQDETTAGNRALWMAVQPRQRAVVRRLEDGQHPSHRDARSAGIALLDALLAQPVEMRAKRARMLLAPGI